MKKYFAVFIVLGLLMLPLMASSAEKITEVTIASDEWKNCTNPDGNAGI